MSHLTFATRRFAGFLVAVWMLTLAGSLAAALNSQEQELASRVINDPGQARASVSIDPTLSAVARAKATDMARRKYFAHVDPDGHGANYLVRKAGYTLPSNYSTDPAANNIESLAAGYATVADVWQGWMGSSSHKTHILGLTSFFAAQTSLGVGFYQDADAPYRYYWVVITAPANAPKLTIAKPTANAALTADTVTVTGTVGGLPEADHVEVRVENSGGNGGFVTATGGASWSASVSGLAPGANTLRVRSFNASGGMLLELTRSVRFIVISALNVSIDGTGTVTRGFAGSSQREVGANFTVTAVPGDGSVFAGWSGGSNSTAAALTMRMSEGLTLTAHFLPNPFIAHKGGYNGLIESDPFTHETSGFVKATVASTGAVSGKVTLGGAVYAFSGKLDLDGDASIVVKRTHLPALTVTLHLDLAGDSETLTGTVTDGAFSAVSFHTDRALQTGAGPSPYAGRYTVALPPNGAGPQGAGWATLTVSTSGVAALAGSLADGAAISVGATVSNDGEFPIYQALYSAKGSIAGAIFFRATNTTDLDGTYHWSKPDRPTSRVNREALSLVNSFAGSRYTAPAAGQTALVVPGGADNLHVIFTGGNLDSAVTQAVTLGTNNHVTVATPLLKSFSIGINVPSGRIAGGFLDPASKAGRHYYGVLLQKQNRGYGYFLGTDATGLLQVEPSDGGTTN